MFLSKFVEQLRRQYKVASGDVPGKPGKTKEGFMFQSCYNNKKALEMRIGLASWCCNTLNDIRATSCCVLEARALWRRGLSSGSI